MADDIVTKLRDFTWDWDDLRAAADEIERLREAGDALAAALNEHADLYADEHALIDTWKQARQ